MFEQDPQRRNWMDLALARVPLPVGFIERLKAIVAKSDEQFDAELREFPVPQRLREELRQIPRDVAWETEMRRIAVPARLSRDLQGIARTPAERSEPVAAPPLLSETALHAQGGTVVENGQPRRIASQYDRKQTIPSWVVAASLLLLATVGWVTSFGVVLTAVVPTPKTDQLVDLPSEESGNVPSQRPGTEQRPVQVVSTLSSQGAPANTGSEANPNSRTNEPVVEAPDLDPRGGELVDSTDEAARWPANWDVFAPRTVRPVLGMPRRNQPQVSWNSIADRDAEGAPLPRWGAKGSVSRFGIAPFVPVADLFSAKMSVPLSFFDPQLVDSHGTGLPVLAGTREVDWHKLLLESMPDWYQGGEGDSPQLIVCGGPVPWAPGDERRCLLLVGVQMPPAPVSASPYDHVVIIVDAAMSSPLEGDWDAFRQTLLGTLESLEPQQRVSILMLDSKPMKLVGDLVASDRDRLSEAIESMQPRQLVDSAGGLGEVLEALPRFSASPDETMNVVAVSSDLDYASRSVRNQLQQAVDQLTQEGIGIQFMASQGFTENQLLHNLASRSGSSLAVSPSSEVLSRELRKAVHGHHGEAATDVQLNLSLNQQVVREIRSIGRWDSALPTENHGRRTAAYPGQVAYVLLEARLEDESADEVMSVQLAWQQAGASIKTNSAPLELEQRLHMYEIASTVSTAPLLWQRMVLSQSLAEVMASSPHISSRFNRQAWFELAASLSPTIQREDWFQFVVSSAERLPPMRWR